MTGLVSQLVTSHLIAALQHVSWGHRSLLYTLRPLLRTWTSALHSRGSITLRIPYLEKAVKFFIRTWQGMVGQTVRRGVGLSWPPTQRARMHGMCVSLDLQKKTWG